MEEEKKESSEPFAQQLGFLYGTMLQVDTGIIWFERQLINN